MCSLCVYIIGLIAYFLCDILVTAHFSPHDIVQWAKIRSLIGLSGIFCLIGLEIVLIRSPQSSEKILKRLLIQIPIVALFVAWVIYHFNFLDSYSQAYFLSVSSAGTIAVSQYFRSHRLLSIAQITQQGWRIFTFLFILFLIWKPDILPFSTSVVCILTIGLTSAVLLVLHFPPSVLCIQNPEPISFMYQIGSRFLVTSTFLTLAIYAEQLLIQSIGTIDQAAIYFTHATYFLFPISLANGYLSFLLSPWIRDNHDTFISILKNYWHILLILIIFYAVILQYAGLLAWIIINHNTEETNSTLRILFLITSIFITLYQLPSAYNGVFAQTTHQDRLILAQIVALLIAISVFCFFLYYLKFNPLICVAYGALTNWLFRTNFGLLIMSVISKNRNNA